MKVGIIGGTGAMGQALASCLSKSCEVMVGSRVPEKAVAAAAKIEGVRGAGNDEVSSWCQAAVIAIPFSAIGELAPLSGALAGKLVMSTVNPLKREGTVLHYWAESGSAAEAIAALLPTSRVCTGFNNVPITFFTKGATQEVDILIAADSRETFEEASGIVRMVPKARPLYVGPLSQAESVERITVLELNATRLNDAGRFSVKFVP